MSHEPCFGHYAGYPKHAHRELASGHSGSHLTCWEQSSLCTVQSALAMVTDASSLNSVPSCSQVGASFLQCPHLPVHTPREGLLGSSKKKHNYKQAARRHISTAPCRA